MELFKSLLFWVIILFQIKGGTAYDKLLVSMTYFL